MYINSDIFWRCMDSKLRHLISEFKYVPYKPKNYAKHEVGGVYWSGYWQNIYTVLEVNGNKIKVEWGDGKVVEHMTSIDPKHDYELKAFEYNKDWKTIDNLFRFSYTAAEIKALIYNGAISDEKMVDDLIKYYFNAKKAPNDHIYYYLVPKHATESDQKTIKLIRDLKKSPHNFNNIKTLEDVRNDNRIGVFEIRDRNNKFIISCDIPKDIKVIEVKHDIDNIYIIILDIDV